MATELGSAYVQLMPSARGFGSETEKELNGELKNTGQDAGHMIGKNLIDTIKKVIVAAGIGKIFKDAIMEGASLEQSLGGVEAIFGEETAKKVQANARAAFQTAGVSANEYMEGVTSFAAALLESTGKDTEKAANVADLAFRDMSDNANRFGTDMASIQNAYQGFAKQNYTMLDNLKLGYGGTKQEMERLLENATKLSGVEYNIENLADVYEAIHVIQEDLNVTGTTAKEAASTFSGSLNMMKAAAKNLMGSVALGEDIGPSLQALTSSLSAFAKNALRLVGNILQNIPSLLREVLNNLGKSMTGSGFIGLRITLMNGITETLGELMDVIFSSGPQFLSSAVTMLTGLVPKLIKTAAGVIRDTAQSVAAQIPVMMSDLLPKILQFTIGLKDSVGDFIDAGITLIQGLIDGIIASIPSLLANIPLIIMNIADIVNENVPKLLKAGITMIISIAKGIWEHRQDILDNLGNILKSILSVVQAINWLALGKQIITFIGNGIKSLASKLPEILKSIGNKARDFFKNINWLQLGKDIINGIVKGISAVGNLIKDMLLGLAKGALNSVKSFLGIGSPSRVFANEVGKWIPAGIASGIEQNVGIVTGAMDDIVDVTTSSIAGDIALTTSANAMKLGTGEIANLGGKIQSSGVVINVYGTPGMDVNQLAIAVEQKIINLQKRRAAAWL